MTVCQQIYKACKISYTGNAKMLAPPNECQAENFPYVQSVQCPFITPHCEKCITTITPTVQ